MSSTIAEAMSEALSSLQLQQSAGCDHCNMCKKPAGLVMMPVRYAATAPSHAHDVDALMPIDSHPNLGEGVTDKVMQRAGYILRCMRQGFFYLYYPGGNAQGQKWEQYQVTYNADFIPLPPDQTPILGPVTPTSCKASDDWMMSRCITIPEAETIPQVWVAFSDTWWDETIKGQVESAPAERMQSFSPSAAMSGDSSLPHTAAMTEVSTWVSEYRPNALSNFSTEVADKDDANNTVSLKTLFNFENYSGDTDQLIDTVQAASGTHNLIFATHDPRGITMELNQEAIMAVAASQQHYDWRISSFAGIQSIKSAVMQRELSSIRRSVEDAFEQQYWFRFRDLEQARTPEEKENISNQLAADWEFWRERALTPERLEREASDEWSSTRNGRDLLFWEDVNEYLKFTDEELQANYQSHVADPLKQDADAIHVPISEDHVTWLTSESLAQCFIRDYRTDQLESGIDYVADFIECLQDGIDRFECASIVKDWAESADVDDPHNLLMRAMGHNQTSHLAALKQAMPGTLEGIVKVMDSFKKIWDQSVKAMAVVESEGRATASAAFTRLVYYTGAPVIELLTASTEKAIKPIYMLATMLSTDYVVIPKITSGTAAQYLDVLGEQIRAMAPAHKKPSKTQVRRFLRRTLKQHGYGTQRFSMPNFITLHQSQIRAAAESSSGGYDVIRKMLESGDDLVLDARKIDEIWARKFTQIANSGFMGSAIGALFGAAGALLAYKALDDAGVFESDEMKWRCGGAVAAMAGGLLEATEKGINALAQMGKLRTSGRLATWASRIGRAGRFFGAIGAFIFAVWDTVNAYKEAMVGNFGMALLYGASAFVGAGIVVAVALAFYVTAFFLVVISIILGIIIAFVADSEMQKWLSHCFYGVSERYPDIETSQQQLQEALK